MMLSSCLLAQGLLSSPLRDSSEMIGIFLANSFLSERDVEAFIVHFLECIFQLTPSLVHPSEFLERGTTKKSGVLGHN